MSYPLPRTFQEALEIGNAISKCQAEQSSAVGEGTHPSEPLPVNQQASALNVGATEGSSGNNRPHFSVASKSLTDGSSYKRKNSGTNDQTDPGVKKLRVDEGGEADIQQPGLLRRVSKCKFQPIHSP